MTAFIDLTASDDEPDKDSHVTGENAFFRELEILRAQNRKLEHENSKLESQLKETRNELKFTRESLGQAIVAMQRKTASALARPSEPSSTSLKRSRSPSQDSPNVLHSSRLGGKGNVNTKDEECKVKLELDPCKAEEFEEKTPFEQDVESQSKSRTTEHPKTLPYGSKRRRTNLSNTDNGSSKMDISPLAAGLPSPSPSLTLSPLKKPKRARHAVVSSGKKEKPEESKDLFAQLHNSVNSYLKSARTLKIHPPHLDARIKRVPFARSYGGNPQHFLQYIPAENNPSGRVKRRVIFPQPEMNPSVPSSPGEPGLIFASRHEILKNPPWTLFVKCNPRVAVWTYMGEYESVICGRLEADKFGALSDKVKNTWGDFLLSQKLDVYLSMRVRIALRKAGVIPMKASDRKKEEVCIAKEKRAVKSGEGKYAISRDDVIRAFSEGDEWIDIIRMTCTSYDHAFAQHIQQTFNNPTAATPGSSASQASIPGEPNSAQNQTQRSSNYLGDTDEDEWMDDEVEENSEDDFVGPAGPSTLGEFHLRRSSRKRPVTHRVPDEDEEESDDMYGF